MKRLGGNVINFNKDISSLKKGESYEDTIKTLSNYGDLIVIRHPQIGKVSEASSITTKPVINAGDGEGEHPTQALLDLYTIYKHFGPNYDTKKILFVGDIKNSRTVHSLLLLIHLHPNMKIYFYPYPGLGPEDYLLDKISFVHQQPKEYITINSNIDWEIFDVVYVTRLQKERSHKGVCNFTMTNEMANKMKDSAIIMHPLPRNEEIHPDVDKNHRCHYFKQMEYGVLVRMCLIANILK
tara:strand:+ start:13804 stop:14520 length:717 start_codon:yes stop_codon:yes gene_type:complete